MADPVRYAQGSSTDQQYLAKNPFAQYSREGNAANWAFKSFQETYGRNPTNDELNQVMPAFLGADKNISDIAGGNALVSQMHQSTQNTPDKLYADQQKQYQDQAPEHADAVKQLFQSQLGRDATPEELSHFGGLLASGTTDQYGIQQFLQQQPEYTQKQDAAKQAQIKTENQGFIEKRKGEDQAFQQQLSGQLAGYDQQYFGEQILPTIQQNFAKQGRSFDSSGFANSATQSAQAQNIERQKYLAGISASQYGDYQNLAAAQNADLNQLSANQYGYRQQNAYQDYANQVAQQQNLMNSGVQAQYQQIQNAQTRGQNIQDFNTQSQLYNQYLAKYGKRNNGMGGLIGGGVGAIAGGMLGGPGGAMVGYQLGSGFGQAGQNAYGGSY